MQVYKALSSILLQSNNIYNQKKVFSEDIFLRKQQIFFLKTFELKR